jgi:hypothetical protein
MPRQASTRTTRNTSRTTKPATAPKANTTTKATTAKTTTSKTNGKPQGTRRQVKPAPFRSVTVVTESYLAIQGLDDEDFDLATCPRCACLVPSGERAETSHRNWHDEIDRIIQQLTETIHGLEQRS